MTMASVISIDERKFILDKEIRKYSKKGYKINSRTATSAQMVKPKQFSCLFASLWFLVFGIGILFYLFWYMAKSDKVIFLEVDGMGRIKRR